MSNEVYEEWKQDPNTGLWHLWRWNAATEQWEVVATQEQAPAGAQAASLAAASQPASPAAKSRSKTWIPIVVIAVVVLVVSGLGYLGYRFFFSTPKEKPAAVKTKTQAKPEPKALARLGETPVIPSYELTKQYCTDYSGICFNYPSDARIEIEGGGAGSGGIETGYVVASDGTRLVSFMDHYPGYPASIRCNGTATTKETWPIALQNTAGRPSAVAFSIMNYEGKSSAELYVTNDPTLFMVNAKNSFNQCIYYLVQPDAGGQHRRVSWFRVADPETRTDTSNPAMEEDLAGAINTPKYRQALEILKTVRNAY